MLTGAAGYSLEISNEDLNFTQTQIFSNETEAFAEFLTPGIEYDVIVRSINYEEVYSEKSSQLSQETC